MAPKVKVRCAKVDCGRWLRRVEIIDKDQAGTQLRMMCSPHCGAVHLAWKRDVDRAVERANLEDRRDIVAGVDFKLIPTRSDRLVPRHHAGL